MQIDGYFNVNDEPVIEIDAGSSYIEVLVDTGFNGSLIIPTDSFNHLRSILKFEGPEEFNSVTGETFLADAYSMKIDWLGKPIRVAVATCREVNEAILGSHMLQDCVLTIDYGNRLVTIIQSPAVAG
jgi:clan AA aspartic protease